jgi:hypothetical protein
MTSDKSVVGYISTLPLFENIFSRTIDPDFQESIITAEDIHTSLCPSDGGVFLSSIAVAPDYQKQSPTSLLLRLALIEDLIGECSVENKTVRISAQALSEKGEACMRSLGMKARGFTSAGWRVYYGRLGREALYSIQEELQRKFAARFKQAGEFDISNERK